MLPYDVRMVGDRHAAWKRHLTVGLAIFALSAADPVAAAEPTTIELHAFDGSAVVKGELVEISHGSYVVKTELGTLRIGLDDAECIGDGCLKLDGFDADFALLSPSRAVQSSMQALLAGYAGALDADLQIEGADEAASEVTIVKKAGNEPLANVSLGLINAAVGDRANPISSGDDRTLNSGRSDALALSIFVEPDRSTLDDGDDDVLLALDAAAVIVHPESSLDRLNRRQIAGLFACEEGASQNLPGDSGVPTLYGHSPQSDTYETFKALVLDPFGDSLCDQVIQLPSDDDIAEAVAGDPNAIGFVDLGHRGEARPLAIEECGLVHEASFFGAKAGDYPLARRIFMTAPSVDQPSASIQRFIDFALDDDGQARLEDSGLIGLNLDTTGASSSNYRLARVEAAVGTVQDTVILGELLDLVQNAVRLSATFRFSASTSSIDEQYSLDNRAQRDLARVVNFLRNETPAGTEVFILGFADTSGDYASNLALSRLRAQSVADKLASLGVPITAIAGFGEEAPIACNDDPVSRAHNRRVEVWLSFPEQAEGQEAVRITM